MNCTRCKGTGFLNLEQFPLPDLIGEVPDEYLMNFIKNNPETDVQVCDCCGDGEGWYGIPGEHYNNTDPPGREGPYAYNGGLCQCH